MDFTLTEEQDDLRALAAQILSDRATTARIEQVETTEERFDRELWSELGKAGLLGIAVPEEHGGLGLGLIELALVCEEHGRTLAQLPLAWTGTAALTLAAHGSSEQQARWLPGVATGETVLTGAVPQSVAVTAGDGALSGTLTGVAYAHVAAAVLVPVGDALYAVDPNGPGVVLRTGESTTRELHAELVLDGAPAEQVGGAGAATHLWQHTVVALAAVQSGVTAQALRIAADYTSNRLQFEKPLSTFQGVAHKVADGYIDNAAIRATMLQAAWRLARGDDATGEVLTAAWWAAEGGQHCVHQTQHVHGGIGADVTYPVHRFFLWGKQIELMLGGASATMARLGDVLVGLEAPGDAIVLPGHPGSTARGTSPALGSALS